MSEEAKKTEDKKETSVPKQASALPDLSDLVIKQKESSDALKASVAVDKVMDTKDLVKEGSGIDANPDDIMNAIKVAKADKDEAKRKKELEEAEASDPLDEMMKEFEDRGYDTDSLDKYDFDFDFGDGGGYKKKKIGYLFSLVAAAGVIYGMVYTFSNIKFVSPFDVAQQTKQCANEIVVPINQNCPPVAAQHEYIYNDGKYVDTKGTEHLLSATWSKKDEAVIDAKLRIAQIERSLRVGEPYTVTEWQNDGAANFTTARDTWVVDNTQIRTLNSRLYDDFDPATPANSSTWSFVFLREIGGGATTLPVWIDVANAQNKKVKLGSQSITGDWSISSLFNPTLKELDDWIKADAATRNFTCTNGAPDYTSTGGSQYQLWKKMTTYESIFTRDYLEPACELNNTVNLAKLYDRATYGNTVKFPIDDIRGSMFGTAWTDNPISATMVTDETTNWSILGSLAYRQFSKKIVPSTSQFIAGNPGFDTAFNNWVATLEPKGKVEWNGTTYNAGAADADTAIGVYINNIVTEDKIIDRYVPSAG